MPLLIIITKNRNMPWEFRLRAAHPTNWYANCFLLKNSFSPGIPFEENNIISCFGMILLVWDSFCFFLFSFFLLWENYGLNAKRFIFTSFNIWDAFYTHSLVTVNTWKTFQDSRNFLSVFIIFWSTSNKNPVADFYSVC